MYTHNVAYNHTIDYVVAHTHACTHHIQWNAALLMIRIHIKHARFRFTLSANSSALVYVCTMLAARLSTMDNREIHFSKEREQMTLVGS